MSKYVDGFVLVVPKENAEAYREMAEEGRESWLKYGALEYYESKGYDLEPLSMGEDKSLSFKEAFGAGAEDDIWFSFIVFESKQARDEVNEKVMAEMDEMYKDQSNFQSPFDPRKMAVGGFEVLVEGLKK